MSEISTKPYLIRAIHQWCSDQGLTPYLSVVVDHRTLVPRQFVQDGQIVLNVSTDATSGLRIGNEFIEFKARFGGVPREIIVPIDRVIAIYARENGQGMAFPLQVRAPGADEAPEPASLDTPAAPSLVELVDDGDPPGPPDSTSAGGRKRPALKRIK